jgi:hypothetical protein
MRRDFDFARDTRRAAPEASHGRLIRTIDATTVPKKGPNARKRN